MSTPLPADVLDRELTDLPGWTHDDDALVRTFHFAGFRPAVAFIVRVAFESEQRDHHPELHNVYDRVTVRLTTHDAGNRVTERDVELAHAIDVLVA